VTEHTQTIPSDDAEAPLASDAPDVQPIAAPLEVDPEPVAVRRPPRNRCAVEACNPPAPREPEIPPRDGRVIRIEETTNESIVFLVSAPEDIDTKWRGVFLDEETKEELPDAAFALVKRGGRSAFRCELWGTNGKLPSTRVRLIPPRH
jgi:hypothetical protein